MTRIAVLAALSWLLQLVEIQLPFLPDFLKYDPSEVTALVGTFVLGPWAGVAIEGFKNVLHLLLSRNATLVGDAANFLAGGTLVLIAGYIYRLNKTRTTAVVALVTGSVVMTVVMSLANLYVLLPLWGVPADQAAPMITGAILPFNLVKALLSSAATFVLYKRVRSLLEVRTAGLAVEEN